MLSIPAGKVTLRDRRTEHSWTVEVETFLLAETPVTQQVAVIGWFSQDCCPEAATGTGRTGVSP